MQELPGLFRAFSAAFEYFLQHIGERQGIEHVIESHAAGGDLIRRQRLQPHLPRREGDARSANQQLQQRIDCRSAPARMVKAGDQKHDAHGDHADALKHAQGAGL